MLETIAVVLVVLWLLGLVTSTTLGGFIHALLVIAIVVILIRVAGCSVRTAGAMPQSRMARPTCPVSSTPHRPGRVLRRKLCPFGGVARR